MSEENANDNADKERNKDGENDIFASNPNPAIKGTSNSLIPGLGAIGGPTLEMLVLTHII